MNFKDIDKKIPQVDLRRKVLHILLGIIGLSLLIYDLITPLQIFIVLIMGAILSLLSTKFRVPIISYFIDNFEIKQPGQLPARAIIFGVAGALLTIQLFPRDIALASIAILAFADPISHLVGRILGKTRHFFDSKKNIEGHIAGAIISSLIAMFFVSPYLALAGSLVAMLFESLIIEIQKIKLDDNLIIPLAAGTTMFLIVRFLI